MTQQHPVSQRVRQLERRDVSLQQQFYEAAARTDAINAKVTALNRIVTVTDDYTITAQDKTIVADKATAITITLPPLANVVGLLTEIGYKFNIVAAGIGVVTVAANGANGAFVVLHAVL